MECLEGKLAPAYEKDSTQCVRVAVNIRPLITAELLVGCTDCISVVPGEPQIQIGSHTFTFDHVFGSGGSPASTVYDTCVAPLVDSLFHGYNATVLAYGQTGSGKTYTMGTSYTGEANSSGIIPKVMEMIFSKVDKLKDSTEFLIRVSFIEIFKEEVFDLLDQSLSISTKSEGAPVTKPSAPAKVPIQIRETVNGGITLAGVTEAEVKSKEEMATYLARGSLSRATGSTNMNSQSSRSHAIFTISMEQKKVTGYSKAGVNIDEIGDDILSAKLHLVDLAGSERAKRTGADGLRLKEGIHINRGLLALGNVISALGDEKKRKEGAHVPYRDSKLTRLLQDSLGGNSKTLMIACVSPADTNAEETLNTLKYANRARNIQNKAIINRDPVAAELQQMRSQLEQLQTELLYYRSEGAAPFEELQHLRHKNSVLETSNAELEQALQERQMACEHLQKSALDAQVEKDKLIMKIEYARKGKSWDEIDSADGSKDFDLVRTYVLKIQELEGELSRLRNLNSSKRNSFMDCLDLEDDGLRPREAFLQNVHDNSPVSNDKTVEISGDADVIEKELEHSSLQDELDKELQELDKKLEQKEAEMRRFPKVDTSVLKQHYEKKLLELEQEKKVLLIEIEELRGNLANISSTSDDGAQKLKEDYLQKLNILESQVAELKRKQDAQSQLLRQKQKSDEAAKRLQEEIQKIKSQKVQLQHKIKQESEQFRAWKVLREKEVLQLKKEGRRNEYEMHKLMALNQRQKMVLQRKTEEASLATKRLKELLEARKASSRETSGVGNGLSIQALMQAIEQELEVMVRVHEVRSEYERQMEARAAMAKEVAKLKEEAEMAKLKTLSDCPQAMSPGARSSRIFALENMLATSSSTLVSMASQLSEAEERERVFSGRGRWNQVRSLSEAKNLMNYLFNLLSSSRCQLRDKEFDCREKESVIKELKEKVVRLNNMVRQMEASIGELHRQEKIQRLASKKNLTGSTKTSGSQIPLVGDERPYDLRKVPRNSYIFSYGGNSGDLEDMDTSDSDLSDPDNANFDDDNDSDWVESGKLQAKKRGSRIGVHKTASSIKNDSRNLENTGSENLSDEEAVNKKMNPTSGSCCTCSKSSSCKKKCECRASANACGESCGCRSSKCTNRNPNNKVKDQEELQLGEVTEGSGSDVVLDPMGTDNTEHNKELVSHGAMLLETALSDRPVDSKEHDVQQRKPLSDIGNTLVKCNAPKPGQRKKWRKSEIQLVPTAPPAPAQPESNEAPRSTSNAVIEPDIPLKLPRAMNPTTVSSNPLRERNSHPTNESNGERKTTANGQRSPVRQSRNSNEKENTHL